MSLLTRIRLLIVFFIVALVVSGLTAFPVESELKWLLNFQNGMPRGLSNWLHKCYVAIADTNDKYPMLTYGYDWLAFAHLIIAMAFIGPLKDPIRNKWIIDWAIMACIAVLPLAFIAGPIREIPFFHILVDCCFGLIGLIPLLICRQLIIRLERLNVA